MDVKNIINSRGTSVKNQFIITDGNNETFQSYDSVICEVNRDNRIVTLYPKWDYSNTTSRYLYQFLNERFGVKLNKKQVLKLIDSGNIGSFKLVLVKD